MYEKTTVRMAQTVAPPLTTPKAFVCVADLAQETIGLQLFLEDFLDQKPNVNKPHNHQQPYDHSKGTEST